MTGRHRAVLPPAPPVERPTLTDWALLVVGVALLPGSFILITVATGTLL